MSKITTGDLNAIYAVSKRVAEGQLKRANAIKQLADRPHISASSVGMYINDFRHMRNGEPYRRAMPRLLTEHFLTSIYRDYGSESLQVALDALWQHIEYRKENGAVVCRQERELHQVFTKKIATDSRLAPSIYPDELQQDSESYQEGSVKQVWVNRYERNKEAREKCIRHWNAKCYVCAFDFEKFYGEIGRGFIHVHHLVELSSIKGEYVIDPINDLRPVCPNCHAMLHSTKPALFIGDLKSKLHRATKN